MIDRGDLRISKKLWKKRGEFLVEGRGEAVFLHCK